MNPEFLREGAAVEDFMNPDRIVVGAIDDRSAETIERVYAPFDCPKLRTTPRNAELIKYASNTLLATLISFSNEIAGLCEAVPGLDEAVVMQGLHLDRRLSPLVGGERLRPGILAFLRAGIGYGGSCLPKDTVALAAFARHHGAETSLLDATIGINDARMGRVLDSIERQAGALRGRTVAILGLAFKPGTDDIRESPGIRLARGAIERGARVRAWDPIATENARRELTDAVAYAASLDEALAGAELAILATAWPELADADWAALSQRMARPVLFDGRSVLAGVRLPDGIAYLTIGRTAR
jgi:UDPglucose 6-dehydrogenase/GDP-mannose 6-dehydrogenase